MKILFPHREAPNEEIEEILKFAIEGRKRVKDQLMRIDQTYEPVRFGFNLLGQKKVIFVKTLEEKQYPQHYHQGSVQPEADDEELAAQEEAKATAREKEEPLKEKHLVFQENQRGVS